jgi:acetyl esterase/lipase
MNAVILWPEGAPLARGNEPADSPSITPYLVSSDEPNACMIVCPGGGYNHLAEPKEGKTIARWLNDIGISAVVLHYRVAPYQHPCPLLDAQRTIRLLRSKAVEWNLNPSKIGILGFSAGGHLAATAGTHYMITEILMQLTRLNERAAGRIFWYCAMQEFP